MTSANQPSIPIESPWPMYRRDAANTAYSPIDTSHNQGRVAWRYFPERPGYHIGGPVILADGTIVITTGKRRLIALDPNGNERWMWRGPRGGVIMQPTIGDDGNIYARTSNDFYCVSAAGETRWSAPFRSEFASGLTAYGGKIYLVSGRELLRSDEPGTLDRVAMLRGKYSKSRPVIDMNGTVYVTTEYAADERADLFAVSPEGKLIWQKHFGMYDDGFGIHDPAIIGSDGHLYVNLTRIGASNPQESYVFDSTGKEVAHLDFPVQAIDPVGRYYSASDNGSSAQCRDSYGTLLWEAEGTGKPPEGSNRILAVSADGSVYVGVHDYVDNGHNVITDDWMYLYAISPAGHVRWVFRDDPLFVQRIAIGADGTIYAVSERHRPVLYALK